jgi:hypothetical protein
MGVILRSSTVGAQKEVTRNCNTLVRMKISCDACVYHKLSHAMACEHAA